MTKLASNARNPCCRLTRLESASSRVECYSKSRKSQNVIANNFNIPRSDIYSDIADHAGLESLQPKFRSAFWSIGKSTVLTSLPDLFVENYGCLVTRRRDQEQIIRLAVLTASALFDSKRPVAPPAKSKRALPSSGLSGEGSSWTQI